MKKKKLLAILLVSTMVFGITACGTKIPETPQETAEDVQSEEEEYADFYIENPEISMEELREANQLTALANNHESFSYVMESYDAEDHLTSTRKGQFTFSDGKLLYDSETGDTYGSEYYVTDYIAEDTPGAEYLGTEIDGEWFGNINLFAQAEYNDFVSIVWMGKSERDTEEVLENSTQDGVIILQVRTRNEGLDGYFDDLYYVDPDTREVVYRESSWYSENGQLISIDRYKITYDEPYENHFEAMVRTTNGKDLCNLTITINPGTDSMEVNRYQVNKGTSVMFESMKDFTMYSDEKMTQEITEIDSTVDETSVFIKINE